MTKAESSHRAKLTMLRFVWQDGRVLRRWFQKRGLPHVNIETEYRELKVMARHCFR